MAGEDAGRQEMGLGGKKVLFPLCPEYLGYAEVGLSDGMFSSIRPLIDIDEGANLYKYSIDFDVSTHSTPRQNLIVQRWL